MGQRGGDPWERGGVGGGERHLLGTELTVPAHALLDMTAFGRSEDWEEPKGRARTLHGADPTFTD
jgi:hypothetical protein